jgi:membrane-bound lytic murein transglycosylase B
LIRLLAAVVLCLACLHADAAEGYAARDDVRAFIDQMVQKHGFSTGELQSVFERTRRQDSVLRAMQAPAESAVRSWQTYRAQFVNPRRVQEGVRFFQSNAASLERASILYGVPAEIIVAIIGVETVYGRNTGNYRVMDALTTLAFDFPPRSGYFRNELELYLLNARDENLDAMTMRGSYAGAVGIPQFMPHAYRRFAVDFDGDGQRDLRGSPADAIGSVGNFLKEHGWRRGEPVAARANVENDELRPLAAAGVKPGFRLEDLRALGVATATDAPPETLCSLVELQTADQASDYWVGFENFFVLTRYNRSSFYAISVLELSRAIRTALQARP